MPGDRISNAPAHASYVLVAPAVWSRAEMNPFERAGLWLISHLTPGLTATGEVVHVTASDDRQAPIRLSRDPLTVHDTRFDAIDGLVNLMDAATFAAPRFTAPSLFLYGGKDELIPPEAMARVWRSLPPGPVRAFYPAGYHLLPRDLGRAEPIGDIIAWLTDAGGTAALKRRDGGCRMAGEAEVDPHPQCLSPASPRGKCLSLRVVLHQGHLAPTLFTDSFTLGRFAVWGCQRTRSSVG